MDLLFYIDTMFMKLRDWIDQENLDWYVLSMNLDTSYPIARSANPNAIELLMANSDKIHWIELSNNPNAIELLMANSDKIHWHVLSINPNAIELLTANQHKINWNWLSINLSAMELLTANPDKINWFGLSCNLDTSYPIARSANPSAIELLEQNQDKINWRCIWRNPAIFEYDYTAIREAKSIETQCIAEYVNHPRFVEEFLREHDMEDLDDFEEWRLNRYVI